MNTLPKISYYAHHMGTGHLRHAGRIVEARSFDVQVTSTGTSNLHLLPPGTNYVPLTSDAMEDHSKIPEPGEYLHYAPVGAPIIERFSALNRAWKQFAPDVVMVDVSVEVALFARLSGYRVALRRMPGTRTDTPHKVGYEVADALFAYYPKSFEDPAHLAQYGSKSHYLPTPPSARYLPGSSQNSTPDTSASSMPRRVAVQTSLGASLSLTEIANAAALTPNWSWNVLGSVHRDTQKIPQNLCLHGTVPHPEYWMSKADVIVTSTGHNAVVAAAVCRKPVVLIPEERPFDEQRSYAHMLCRATGYPMVDSWNAAADWNTILDQALTKDSDALSRVLFESTDRFISKMQDLVNQVMVR